MKKCLLSILLASWSLVITNAGHCDTGSAAEGQVLSVPRSSLANADVAFLKQYSASSLSECLDDCCDGKFGICTVASFIKNPTRDSNCLHFNCRPLHNCKFISSNDTDSFTYPAPLAHFTSTNTTTATTSVLSNNTTTTTSTPKTFTSNDQPSASVTKEEIATFSEEQFDFKNDNTTIKPRKGVKESEEIRSGVKPRKGVSLEDFKYTTSFFNRSKVKPRKGVELYPTIAMPTATTSSLSVTSSSVFHNVLTSTADHYEHQKPSIASDNVSVTDELLSDLKMVFEDDLLDNFTSSNTGERDDESVLASKMISHTPSYSTSLSFTDQNFPSATTINRYHSSFSEIQPSGVFLPQLDTTSKTPFLNPSKGLLLESTESTTSSSEFKSSDASAELETFSELTTSCDTPIKLTSTDDLSSVLHTSDIAAYSSSSDMAAHLISSDISSHSTSSDISSHSTSSDISSSSTISITSNIRTMTQSTPSTPSVIVQSYQIKKHDDEESEKERKYKSSMHLVLSLVFGLLVLFAVLGVVARRVYDGWLRRHYRRMDFLIDGMYHGYE